jgi:hypothetical protein
MTAGKRNYKTKTKKMDVARDLGRLALEVEKYF